MFSIRLLATGLINPGTYQNVELDESSNYINAQKLDEKSRL